jgi:hypothetical protein
MKKIIMTFWFCTALIILPIQKSHAFFWVVINAAVKKALKAADLQIQRQQNKVIWLQNAQKVLENALSETRLGEITEWTKKQKEQYKKYYEELQKVRSIIVYYQRIKSIAQKQAGLFRAYQKAWGLIRKDGHFSSDEIQYMGRVYNGILDESVENLDQIMLVINSFKTEMSDAKRMEIIDAAADKIDQNYADLLQFNSQNAILSLQRSKDAADISMIKQLYGLK